MRKMIKSTFNFVLVFILCMITLLTSVYADEEQNADYNIENYGFYLTKNEFTYYPFDSEIDFVKDNVICYDYLLGGNKPILHWNSSKAPHGFSISDINITVDNINAGTRNIIIKPNYASYSGMVVLPITIKPLKISVSDIRIDPFDIPWCYYNGKYQKPKFDNIRLLDLEYKIKGRGGDDYYYYQFVEPNEYKVNTQIYRNNRNVGAAKVTFEIEFLNGNFEDNIIYKEYEFSIYPPKTKITSTKRNNTSFTISWKKVKQIDKYKVNVYHGNKLIAYKSVKPNAKRSYTVTGLKRHEKYSVEVLTIKKVKGMNYTSWSKTKNVLTK